MPSHWASEGVIAVLLWLLQGYSRKGSALFKLERLQEAKETYTAGLKVDPDSAMLKDGLSEVQAKQRLGESKWRGVAWGGGGSVCVCPCVHIIMWRSGEDDGTLNFIGYFPPGGVCVVCLCVCACVHICGDRGGEDDGTLNFISYFPPGRETPNIFADPSAEAKLRAHPKTSKYMDDPAFVKKIKSMQTGADLKHHIQDPRVIEAMGVLMGVDLSTMGMGEWACWVGVVIQ